MYVNRDVTEMQLNVQLQPLLGDYLSFIPSETIKNATECIRNSYKSWVILLVFPPGEKKRARVRACACMCVCVCARACLCVGPAYFTDSSLFNFRLYGNMYKMRGCAS